MERSHRFETSRADPTAITLRRELILIIFRTIPVHSEQSSTLHIDYRDFELFALSQYVKQQRAQHFDVMIRSDFAVFPGKTSHFPKIPLRPLTSAVPVAAPLCFFF